MGVMMSQAVVHDTFVVQRVYPASPGRVFKALAQTETKRRWFAEGDHHDVEAFEQEFQIGGSERLQYRYRPGTMFPGVVVRSDGWFLDIVPERRIVTASSMTFAERRISASLVTMDLTATQGQTELVCTFQGAFFEGSDGPKIRVMGWRTLLDKLAVVVERNE